MVENQLQVQNKNPAEVWKDVPGYEGIYSASTTGFIRNYGRQLKCAGKGREKPKILKPFRNYQGYLRIRLVDKDGNRKMFGIHRIIAMTFIPNPDNKPCIDHINAIRDDNRVENLRWCTIMENAHNPITEKKYRAAMMAQRGKTLYPEHRRKLSEARKGYKPSQRTRDIWRNIHQDFARPIIQLSLDGEFIKEWKSALFASIELRVDKSSIYKCIKGKLHKTGGFKWKLK